MAREIYFSVDIESDGPIPGKNSMLSFGAAAFNDGGILLESFSRNLHLFPGAEADPDTMAWWKTQPEAWAECRKALSAPNDAMGEFVVWVKRLSEKLKSKPVCVAYPAGFDWTFLYWYMRYFGYESPFGFQCLDIKSFAMAVMGTDFRNTTKRNMPKAWFEGLPVHTHVACDDAIEQGHLFFKVLDASKRKRAG